MTDEPVVWVDSVRLALHTHTPSLGVCYIKSTMSTIFVSIFFGWVLYEPGPARSKRIDHIFGFFITVQHTHLPCIQATITNIDFFITVQRTQFTLYTIHNYQHCGHRVASVTTAGDYRQTILGEVLWKLAMHSLTAASRPRLSETEPKWFVFETSCYAFGGRIRRFAKLNVNKVKNFYCIIQTNKSSKKSITWPS